MGFIDYLLIFSLSLALATGFLFLLRKIVLKFKVLIPRSIPLVGGIAVGLAFVIICYTGNFFLGSLSKEITGIVFASGIMLVFGVIDDIWELSVVSKFSVQVIACLFLIYFNVRTHIVFLPDFLNFFVTVVWVVGITNAFNHLDIMDGLAAGICVIVAASFCVISFIHFDRQIMILSLVLAGTASGFLLQNLPPAKVYLGNAGSHFLGFILAAVALSISYAGLNNKVALLSPILVLGFPIFDTAFVILMRMRQRRSIVKKSNDHFALRLLKLGFSKSRALVYMLCLALLFSLSGVALIKVSNFSGFLIILILGLMSLLLVENFGKVAIDG